MTTSAVILNILMLAFLLVFFAVEERPPGSLFDWLLIFFWLLCPIANVFVLLDHKFKDASRGISVLSLYSSVYHRRKRLAEQRLLESFKQEGVPKND